MKKERWSPLRRANFEDIDAVLREVWDANKLPFTHFLIRRPSPADKNYWVWMEVARGYRRLWHKYQNAKRQKRGERKPGYRQRRFG